MASYKVTLISERWRSQFNYWSTWWPIHPRCGWRTRYRPSLFLQSWCMFNMCWKSYFR